VPQGQLLLRGVSSKFAILSNVCDLGMMPPNSKNLAEESVDTIAAIFDSVSDPRVDRTKLYSVGEIMFLILCAVLCGVDSWRGVEDFGEDRLDWLRKYLPFEHGIPSHQTLGRVMSLLKPSCVNKAFIQFISSLLNVDEDKIISLDGKTLRHSFDKATGQKPIHILNAWAVNAGLAIGQLKVESKTNEITAVPELLDLLDIKFATVVSDALITQKSIAAKLVDKECDYALPVKGNHKQLQEDVALAFDTNSISESDVTSFLKTVEKDHGRIETRTYSILPADTLEQQKEWAGLKFIGKVVNETYRDGKNTQEIRHYLLTFGNVSRFAKVTRGHWGIENSLHWVLDVTFGEDACRVRKDHAPENFSSVRKLALNILRQNKSTKLSIPRKQARAARNTSYLDELLRFGAI
jgi:predicted transposase YbfD/YdcC